jgi:hypothetical protein
LIAYRDEAYPLKKWDAIPFWVRDNLVKKEADIFKVPLNGPFAQMESVTLGIPENIFADAVFHRNWPTCIVHGDMHGGNIIVSRGTRPILIDYRNVGVGPRCMDYAALEASIRLSVPESEGPDRAPDIVRWTKHEKETLRHVWQGNAPHPNSSPTYWQTVSTELGLLARANFRRRKPEDAPDLELQEYVATCILWCLRIIQNTKFTSLQKRRLLIWMSELYQCLSRPGKLIADRGH